MACRNLREKLSGTLAPSLRMQVDWIIHADAQTADLPTNQVGCKRFEITIGKLCARRIHELHEHCLFARLMFIKRLTYPNKKGPNSVG